MIFLSEGLNPKFLVRESFYLADFYELIDETLWQEGEVDTVATVTFSSSIDIEPTQYPRLYDSCSIARLDDSQDETKVTATPY